MSEPREMWIKLCDYIPDRVVYTYEEAKCSSGCTHSPTKIIEYSTYEQLEQQCEKLASVLDTIATSAPDCHSDNVYRANQAITEYQAFKEKLGVMNND